MTKRILVVGGTGHIGRAVARDLFAHTDAHLTVTGRDPGRGEAAAAIRRTWRLSSTRPDGDAGRRARPAGQSV
ncbi:MAG: KR domain-containing protein [Caldilineaceae bacterium]|nr:KR domain-containing protein [Caldilineaceae bacterium]